MTTDFFTPKHLHFHVSETKKSEGRFCCAYACRKKPCDRKRGLCHMHYHRHRRIVDPIYNRYVNFKGNALKRHKDFTITLQEFREWCEKTRYLLDKGKRGRNCTIDRIENQHGYHIWNIQIKSNLANIKKYHGVDKHITELPITDCDYVPF